jgi:hypothetical protein
MRKSGFEKVRLYKNQVIRKRQTGYIPLDGQPAPAALPVSYRNVQRFRGGLVSKAHGLLYHSSLGLRIIKKKEKSA